MFCYVRNYCEAHLMPLAFNNITSLNSWNLLVVVDMETEYYVSRVVTNA